MAIAESLGRSRDSRDRVAATTRVWLTLLVLLIVVALVSLGVGRYHVPIANVLGILLSNVLPIEPVWTNVEERVVELIRLPRVLIAAFAGGGLAIAGAALQGTFRNPLVGPQIIGVSSGAAFGGALAILISENSVLLVAFAFGFGLLSMAIVYGLSRVGGRSPILMLVLAGVVTSAFFTALVSLIKYVADPDDKLPAIVYWLMGSFATADYGKVGLVGAAVGIGGALVYLLRFRINLLSLGDEEAEALGVKVECTRWLIIVCVTMITASVVAVAGVVGWVGLVVPHIARMAVGPDHRVLIPTAALIGAMYLIVIDDVARAATAAEIPLGVITAIIGAPVFGYLLRRTQAKGWKND